MQILYDEDECKENRPRNFFSSSNHFYSIPKICIILVMSQLHRLYFICSWKKALLNRIYGNHFYQLQHFLHFSSISLRQSGNRMLKS